MVRRRISPDDISEIGLLRKPVDELVQLHGAETVVAALSPYVSAERQARIEEVLATRLSSLTVAVENLHDPHNGAATVRSVEAFGLSEVHAVEGFESFRVLRSITIGCEQWISSFHYKDIAACMRALKSRGMRVCATLPDATLTLEDLDWNQPRALLFGNEHEGITEAAQELCDEAIRIPMFGFSQSLNLSVSVAITVAEAAKHRRAALGCPGDLDESAKMALRPRWYANGVRGIAGLVDRYVSSGTQ